MSQRVIRVADIATTKERKGLLPVSPATIWRWVREDKFPKPFKLGESCSGLIYADTSIGGKLHHQRENQ